MIYQDNKGNLIKTIEEWKELFIGNPKKNFHWKEGRSAYELANFMLNENGEKILSNLISNVIGESLYFEKAIPELETRFDKYGHGREHDLGLWGITKSGKSVFIGIEAKVDEEFNYKVSEAYISAKTKELNGEKTNAPTRIEKILERGFYKIQKKHWNLMYQLFYTLFGTLDSCNDEKKSDIPIMLILVFKTDLFDNKKGEKNHHQYIEFIEQFDAERTFCEENAETYKVRIENKILYSIYYEL